MQEDSQSAFIVRRRLLGLVMCAILARCGGDGKRTSPTENPPPAVYPNVVGIYASGTLWAWRITHGQDALREPTCAGTIEISAQAQESISVTYRAEAPCGPIKGTVAGVVGPTGKFTISFVPGLKGAIPEATIGSPCGFLFASGSFGSVQGTFASGQLSGAIAGVSFICSFDDLPGYRVALTVSGVRESP